MGGLLKGGPPFCCGASPPQSIFLHEPNWLYAPAIRCDPGPRVRAVFRAGVGAWVRRNRAWPSHQRLTGDGFYPDKANCDPSPHPIRHRRGEPGFRDCLFPAVRKEKAATPAPRPTVFASRKRHVTQRAPQRRPDVLWPRLNDPHSPAEAYPRPAPGNPALTMLRHTGAHA